MSKNFESNDHSSIKAELGEEAMKIPLDEKGGLLYFSIASSLTFFKSQTLGLITHRSYMNGVSSVTESKKLFTGSFQHDRNFILTFCILHAWERSHLMSPSRLFSHAYPVMNKFINQCYQAAKSLLTCLMQSVKVIHHCDWDDNKHVLPSCIRTQCIMVRWCPAWAYHASNQACNCVIAARRQWHRVLYALQFSSFICFSTHKEMLHCSYCTC